jgi:hypothetical protein
MAECSVRVICRFRPFNEREKKEMGSVDNSKSGVAITFPSDQSVMIKTPENPKQVHFSFPPSNCYPLLTRAQVFNLDFIFDSNKAQVGYPRLARLFYTDASSRALVLH